MIAVLLITAFATQVQVGRDSADKKTVSVGVRVGATNTDSARRIPLTPALLTSAFHDATARATLNGARKARLGQDSALRTYDAKAFQRISIGLALRATGHDRLMMRDEAVARIQYDRRAGAVVDLLGKRTTVPPDDTPEQDNGENLRNQLVLPIPYFPGRETLWMGSSIAKMDVDEASFIHPFAEGSEAYYTYATGDSVTFMLQDGKQILLRELRVEARQPHWNLIVGSFWFDRASSQLVRAVYRPSIELNVWEVAMEEAKRDSSDDAPPGWVRGIISPVRVSIEVFSVEYSLFEGQFWLPVSQGAEGKFQVSFVRVPGTFQERYVYAGVNGTVDVMKPMAAAPPVPRSFDSQALRDSLRKTGISQKHVDSLVSLRRTAFNDSLPGAIRRRAVVDSLMATGMKRPAADSFVTARVRKNAEAAREARQKACAAAPDSVVVRHISRYQRTLEVVLRTPCDLNALRRSPELPKSAYEPGEEVFGTKQRDELLKALDFGLQAGWGPQKIGVDWGLGQSRYNRVEGFSTGIALHQEMGRGYSWAAKLRGNQGDKQINGELGVTRGNGRATLTLNAYRRLTSANDWGEPLTLSASLPGLLYARDEGFYFRSLGAELTRASDRGGHVTWRLFAEQQSDAPVTTRFSVFGGMHDDDFIRNIDSVTTETFAGGSMRWQQTWGLAPRGWHTIADLRLEGAKGLDDHNYGRGALDLTISHPIVGPVVIGLTGSGGSSVGSLPAQRHWFLGSVQTIRGQDGDVAQGNAYWFGRAELARQKGNSRESIFGDLGWAGSRDGDWGRSQRLISGVGVGSSFLDGLVRLDLARGLYPKRQWRFDLSLEARF